MKSPASCKTEVGDFCFHFFMKKDDFNYDREKNEKEVNKWTKKHPPVWWG